MTFTALLFLGSFVLNAALFLIVLLDHFFPPTADSSDKAFDISQKKPDLPKTWLDEMCLEPLASEPGFSRVCNACIRVFRVDPDYNKRANHVQYLDTLVRSAQRGCVLCALILYKIESRDPNYRSSHQANITYKLWLVNNKGSRQQPLPFITWHSNQTELGSFDMSSLGNKLDLLFDQMYANVPFFQKFILSI